MDEIDKEIVVKYYTSPAAAASEVTMRQAMRRAGLSEAEIDESLLVYYVQRSLFRRWAIVPTLAWVLLWVFDIVEQPWILVVGAAGTLLALLVLARLRARAVTKLDEWVRVRGGWRRRDGSDDNVGSGHWSIPTTARPGVCSWPLPPPTGESFGRMSPGVRPFGPPRKAGISRSLAWGLEFAPNGIGRCQ